MSLLNPGVQPGYQAPLFPLALKSESSPRLSLVIRSLEVPAFPSISASC